MALAVEGTYDVLSIVDQTHLDHVVVDKITRVTLGWSVRPCVHQAPFSLMFT